MISESAVERYDHSTMRNLLIGFPEQIKDAVKIGSGSALGPPQGPVKDVVVTGLGGSAIGGDLLRTYLAGELSIPFSVNRHYFLPDYVSEKSLVIVSSYSGNTEETLAAHADATRRNARVICITSNGETLRIAKRHRQPLVLIPKGYPPRAALGYSFFAPLVILSRTKLIRPRQKDIAETIGLLSKKARFYSTHTKSNPAIQIAEKLHRKLPVIYSSADRFDVVNLRWRGQIAENAKMLAFGHVLPEMNHNELVGWNVSTSLMNQIVVIMLMDRDDHPRVKLRMKITADVLRKYASGIIELHSEGTSLLARMFSLIYLGDWVSYYLAILNKVDPTPVAVIDMLKKRLGRLSSS